MGFSGYSTWAQQLLLPGSRAQPQQLWCTDSVAPWHVGSSQLEIEPVSPTLAGGFFTTEPPDTKSRLIGKDPDAGKDRWQKKGAREDERVEQHHRHNGHEFEQTLEESERTGSLVCCSPKGHKESDATERLNTTTTYKSMC